MGIRIRMTSSPGRGRAPMQAPKGCMLVFFALFGGMGLLFLLIMTAILFSGQGELVMLPFMLIPLVFAAIGIGGIYGTLRDWKKSPESLSVVVGTERALPIPKGNTLPGEALAVRLQPETTAKASVLGIALFALFWNGIVGTVAFAMVNARLQGENVPLFAMLFIGVFVLIGLGIIVGLIRQLMIAAGVRMTVVEIEREPVCPGERVRIRIAQPGRLDLDNLSARLVCEERITYTRGTDTYHDKQAVWEQPLFQTGPMRISALSPWEQSVDVELPSDAMHSFHASHNDIVWVVIVKGVVRRWPDYEFKFPMRVVPNGTRELVPWP